MRESKTFCNNPFCPGEKRCDASYDGSIEGYVYLMVGREDPDSPGDYYCKIGYSKAPHKRAKQLKHGFYKELDLQLVHMIPSSFPKLHEGDLHDCFGGKRYPHEMFILNDFEIACFTSITSLCPTSCMENKVQEGYIHDLNKILGELI